MNKKLIITLTILLTLLIMGCGKQELNPKTITQTTTNELDTKEIQELDNLSAELDLISNLDTGMSSVKEAQNKIVFNTKVNTTK